MKDSIFRPTAGILAVIGSSDAPAPKDFLDTVTRQIDSTASGASAYSNVMTRRPDTALRILRMKQLRERTSLSRATLYGLMSSDPTFPRKIKLTARSIGFLESEVDAWITSRAALRQVRRCEEA